MLFHAKSAYILKMPDRTRHLNGIKWYILESEMWMIYDLVVREKRLELLHTRRQNLNLVRLPISPLPRTGFML